jgi:hypothetical protein
VNTPWQAAARAGSFAGILMNALKVFCLTVMQLVKHLCLLPWTIVKAIKQKRQQAVVNENEAERLDRIRNPSKYLGKP